MKQKTFSRRIVLFGMGCFALGGAFASVIGFTYRNELKSLLGYSRASYVRVWHATVGDDGWLLSEKERAALEARGKLVASELLDIRDSVDLPGGDYNSFRASNLQDCVSACENESKCLAFTYARASHPSENKRRMCRLKDGSTSRPVSEADHYISGRRGKW